MVVSGSGTPSQAGFSGGALNPYILNQDISKWQFSTDGAVAFPV